mgnify:CR=1 FL=1
MEKVSHLILKVNEELLGASGKLSLNIGSRYIIYVHTHFKN